MAIQPFQIKSNGLGLEWDRWFLGRGYYWPCSRFLASFGLFYSDVSDLCLSSSIEIEAEIVLAQAEYRLY